MRIWQMKNDIWKMENGKSAFRQTMTNRFSGRLFRQFGLLFLLPVALFPFSPSRCAGQEIVDKTVATVNGGVQTDLITYSDLLWQLALQPNSPLATPNS